MKTIRQELEKLLSHDNPRVVTATKESIHALYDFHIKPDRKHKAKRAPVPKKRP